MNKHIIDEFERKQAKRREILAKYPEFEQDLQSVRRMLIGPYPYYQTVRIFLQPFPGGRYLIKIEDAHRRYNFRRKPYSALSLEHNRDTAMEKHDAIRYIYHQFLAKGITPRKKPANSPPGFKTHGFGR